MEITTREITLNDARSINDLTIQLGYNLTLEETENVIGEISSNKDHHTFVAINNEKVVGWIHGFKALRIECNPFVEIGGLVVDKDSRGKGIGKLLIERIKQWSSNENITLVKVRSNTKRLDAHRFYHTLGFSENKEQKVFEMRL